MVVSRFPSSSQSPGNSYIVYTSTLSFLLTSLLLQTISDNPVITANLLHKEITRWIMWSPIVLIRQWCIKQACTLLCIEVVTWKAIWPWLSDFSLNKARAVPAFVFHRKCKLNREYFFKDIILHGKELVNRATGKILFLTNVKVLNV